ncbi:MAG: hypothetical protein SVR94_12525, partial [Pseudomonadota bacterium]|nr:hypothetical protein [Pseudomonadota bacterium]
RCYRKEKNMPHPSFLTVLTGPNPGQEFCLPLNKTVTLGNGFESWLFLPHEYGIEGLRQCASAHEPSIKKKFLEGFELIAQGKLGEGAEKMLRYEQLELLPKTVYIDEDFVKAIRINQYLVKTVGEIPSLGVKKIKVAFSAECDGGTEVIFDGWHLDDDEQRWPYAKQIGETFQSLVEQHNVFIFEQLHKIINYQQPVYQLFDEFAQPDLKPTLIPINVDTLLG